MDIFEIRLKELRTENGFTQKGLAQLLRTTDDSIHSWEKGRSQPSIDVIRRLCVIFNVSADYLLGLKDELGAKIYAGSYVNVNNGTVTNNF